MDRSIRRAVGPALAEDVEHASRRSRHLAALGMLLIDQALIFVGFLFAYWLRYRADWPEPFDRLKRPVPLAMRGPATACKLAWPAAETWPVSLIG